MEESVKLCQFCLSPIQRKIWQRAYEYRQTMFCSRQCSARSRTIPLSKKLSENIEFSESGCWEWQRYRDRKGYGRISSGGPNGEVLAHRISYIYFRGEIPDGLHILHHCDNPSCINPDHIYAGTNDDNMRDRVERGRAYRPIGEKNPKAKITPSEVVAIRRSSQQTSDLAKRYGVNITTIKNIKSRRTWRHI